MPRRAVVAGRSSLLHARPRAASARCRAEREPAPAGTARVVRPVDGDTIVVDIGGPRSRCGSSASTRPESVAQDRPVECYGPEAKARTAELLPGGHRSCGSSATSRRATATTGCSPT